MDAHERKREYEHPEILAKCSLTNAFTSIIISMETQFRPYTHMRSFETMPNAHEAGLQHIECPSTGKRTRTTYPEAIGIAGGARRTWDNSMVYRKWSGGVSLWMHSDSYTPLTNLQGIGIFPILVGCLSLQFTYISHDVPRSHMDDRF